MAGRILFTAAAGVTALVAAFHLLFALANFELAGEDDEGLIVPLLEGVFSFIAATSLVVAAVYLLRRSLFRASVVVLAGTVPLPIFFAFTVPEHSGWPFLFASFVLPVVSGVTAVGSGRRRNVPPRL
ncbi:MAG: hypothetical protein M3377_04790 [Actinomycetota bacterium]|nr:hypothetical protein [Actinomycetota bacterium]